MNVLLKGTPLSPGRAIGRLRKVRNREDAKTVTDEEIVFGESLLPPIPAFAKKARGFILCGSGTDHGAAYVREAWIPSVLVKKLPRLKEGELVTLDGTAGRVLTGRQGQEKRGREMLKEDVKAKIYLQMGLPFLAERAAQLKTDGIGLARMNLLVEETGKHPYYHFIRKGKEEELSEVIAKGIEKLARAFSPKPVWVRTLDFSTDELSLYEGGDLEQKEGNPLLGWRGIARDLGQPALLEAEYRAVHTLIKKGVSNIGILFPMLRDVSEVRLAKARMKKCGMEPHKDIKVGVMIETPSSALTTGAFILEGLDYVFIGINDLTQYTLATDRANPRMRKLYNPASRAVLTLVYRVIEECKKSGVEVTMSYQSPLKKHIPELLRKGLSGFVLHADAINEVGRVIAEYEAKNPF